MKRTLMGAEWSIYQAILRLQTGPEVGPTVQVLADETGYPAGKLCKHWLSTLLKSGMINRARSKQYGRPYMYYASDWKPGKSYPKAKIARSGLPTKKQRSTRARVN